MSLKPTEVFKAFLKRWFFIALALGIFLMLCRITALFYYGEGFRYLRDNPGDLGRAFFMGLRFDLVTLSYGMVPPVLAYLLWLFFPGPGSAKILTWFERVWFVFVISIVAAITLMDLGYYSYFQDRINVLIFGFFEDDTMALIRTFRKNYPFFTILAASGVTLLALGSAAARVFSEKNYIDQGHRPQSYLSFKVIGIYLLLIPLIGLGARGSIGLFPLHEIDAAVSPDPFLNYLAYSGVHGLHRAVKVRREHNEVWNKNGLFYGYGRWQEAAADLFAVPVDQLPNDPIELLSQKTPKNDWAEKTKPHVVVIMMESWGGYWMSWQSPEFNVLGELEKHFETDNVLMNFLPSMTATIGSLSALMVSTPHRPEGNFLTESRYMQVPFRFAPAKQFKRAGYKTRFLCGGGIGWRTVDRFAKIQSFDSIEGDFAIESRYGKIDQHDWGIYDQDLFRYIEDTLKEATEPQFIFVMTTTNHPPYQVPDDYQALPLKIPEALQSQLVSDEQLSNDRFRVYQYSNRMLGQMMDRIKASPLGDKTIMAVTGDHGFLLKNFGEDELLQKWQTPLYLYMPKETFRKIPVDTFGGHIDIMPTLFDLSLSEFQHFSWGQSLLSENSKPVATHYSRLAFSAAGAVIADQNSSQYFTWAEKYKKLARDPAPTVELEALNKRYRAMMGLTDYFYEFELEVAKGAAAAQ